MITLYWSPGTAAMAPQACLEEAGADYEMVRVRRDGYTVIEPEGYLAIQPGGRIPALRDGDLVLTTSRPRSACTSPTASPTWASCRRSARPSAPTRTAGSPTSLNTCLQATSDVDQTDRFIQSTRRPRPA